jgi:hypothetical protein
MSAKTIRLYQAHTGKRPSPAEEIRATAAKLRNYAAGIMARAQELEESADILEGK